MNRINSIKSEFGIMLTREALNISEEEVADCFWISLHTYRRWEKGERSRVMHQGVLAFVKKYDLTCEWILSGDPAGLPPPLPAQLASKPTPKMKQGGVVNFAAWKARRERRGGTMPLCGLPRVELEKCRAVLGKTEAGRRFMEKLEAMSYAELEEVYAALYPGNAAAD